MKAQATDGQLSLLLLPELRPLVRVPAKRLSHAEQFTAFHAANPQVYEALRTLALQLVRAGRDRIGMKMLWECLRYVYLIQVDNRLDDYALNNNLTSRYARLLMEQEPELAGRFETRELRS